MHRLPVPYVFTCPACRPALQRMRFTQGRRQVLAWISKCEWLQSYFLPLLMPRAGVRVVLAWTPTDHTVLRWTAEPQAPAQL